MAIERKAELDKNIENLSSYEKMIRKIIHRMFDVNSEEAEVRKIYIDINSCLSVIFRGNQYNDESVKNELKEVLEKFISVNILNRCQLVFMFTLEPSVAHIEIYPDWCKERYERVNLVKSSFLRDFMMAIKSYAEKNNSIKIVNTHKVHPSLVVYKTEMSTRKPFLVMTKDLVFHSLRLKHCSIFNGTTLIDLGNDRRELPEFVSLNDPDVTLPYFLSLSGSSREEFKGMSGYGPARSSKYVNEHAIDIKLGAEHPLKEHMDKYSVLFDVAKLLEINKEDIPLV